MKSSIFFDRQQNTLAALAVIITLIGKVLG
jgi:hypothetical protein